MIRIYQKKKSIWDADNVINDMVEKNIKTSSVMIRALLSWKHLQA